jgi:CubicO group peptidase (beta-lactamase class C family)
MLLVASLLVACSDDATGSPSASADGCAALDFDRFDATVAEFVSANALPGASAAIVDEACGVAHVRGYGDHAADRLYLVGSASKVLSAGILLRLQDKGQLDIDAPIGQYLSEWGANGKPDLTIAQLLSNSSGLVGLIDRPFYLPYRCQYQEAGTLGACARAIYTADDASDRSAPDTAFHYGGAQWQLAGGIAEIVSGTSWAELVQETYVEPCRTLSIGYSNQFEAAAAAAGLGAALQYPAFFRAERANLPSTENPNVEGGLFTTAEDYAQILLSHLHEGQCSQGRVLSPEAVERMQADRILERYDGSTVGQTGRTARGDAALLEGYGLGWWIDRHQPGLVADPGLYGAFPWLDRSRGYGALLLLEADGNRGAELWLSVKPELDAIYDARTSR